MLVQKTLSTFWRILKKLGKYTYKNYLHSLLILEISYLRLGIGMSLSNLSFPQTLATLRLLSDLLTYQRCCTTYYGAECWMRPPAHAASIRKRLWKYRGSGLHIPTLPLLHWQISKRPIKSEQKARKTMIRCHLWLSTLPKSLSIQNVRSSYVRKTETAKVQEETVI